MFIRLLYTTLQVIYAKLVAVEGIFSVGRVSNAQPKFHSLSRPFWLWCNAKAHVVHIVVGVVDGSVEERDSGELRVLWDRRGVCLVVGQPQIVDCKVSRGRHFQQPWTGVVVCIVEVLLCLWVRVELAERPVALDVRRVVECVGVGVFECAAQRVFKSAVEG